MRFYTTKLEFRILVFTAASSLCYVSRATISSIDFNVFS